METKDNNNEQASEMRRRAEEIYLNEAPPLPENPAALPPEELRKILHELRVHQIQLEMQNEELRRTQAQLDSARARYFDLYDLAPVGYLTLSERGLILEVNLTAADMLDTDRGALAKRPISLFIFKEDQDIYYLHRKQLFETGAPQICDLRLVKKDGTAFWAHLEGTLAQNPDCAPVCRLVISDITGRKLAEETLLAQKDKYQALFDDSHSSIFVVDIETEIILDANKNAERLTGRPRTELIGMARKKLHPPEQVEYYENHFQKHVSDGTATLSDAVVERKNGTRVPVQITATVLTINGRKVIQGLFEDISEHKNLEEAIQRSMANLSATLNATVDGILAIGADGKIVFKNQRLSELWNIPKTLSDTDDSKAIIDHILPQLSDPDAFLKEAQHPCDTGKTSFDTLYFKDGRVFEFYITPLPRKDPAQGRGRVWSFHDITERKWAEEELRESEETMSATLRSMGDGVITTDAAGRITNLNSMAEEMTGWTTEQAAGQPVENVFRIIHSDPLAPDESPVRYVLRENAVVTLVNHTTLIARDGTRYAIADSCAPIHNAAGDSIGTVLIFSNVTEEYALREKMRFNEKYQIYFEGSGDALMILKPPSWRFTAGNPAAIKMFGAKDETEFISCEPWKLSPERQPDGRASAEKAKEMIDCAMRDGSNFFEWTHRRISGSEFPATVLLSRIEQDKELFLQATVRDITETKQIETIKQVAEAKSKFASMVSHELRSPLTSITLGVGLVLEDAARLSAEHKNMLELVRDNADRLGRLINNVLDFQKISAGRMPFDIRENDIAGVVSATVRSMSLMAKAKGLDLAADISPDLPRAMFDKDKIIQVLTNLLANAIAHTEKGIITVRAGNGGNMLRVSVRDTGGGIKAANLSKLFQPFEQLGGGGKHGGTGLGLAISKEIIVAHKGKIWAESEEGKGSVFHFELPLIKAGG